MSKKIKKVRLSDVRPLDQRNKKVPYEILNGKVHHLKQQLRINKSKRFAPVKNESDEKL
jgi:hypothetical protein